MNTLVCSAAILRGVSKKAAPERAPVWRERIANAVRKHGRLKEVADAAGMSSSQLQKLANGKVRDPRIGTLERIAVALDVTLQDLLFEPRPEEDSGHAEVDVGGGGSGLADSLRRAVAEYEGTGQYPEGTTGDILIAIFALTRALQRSPAAGDAGRATGTDD